MTNEELNFNLYVKMLCEFEALSAQLKDGPPDVILNRAYEYATKQDILYCMENEDFPDKQCRVLMKLEQPLDAVFQHYEKHGRSRIPDLYNAVDAKANALLREEFFKRRQTR